MGGQLEPVKIVYKEDQYPGGEDDGEGKKVLFP